MTSESIVLKYVIFYLKKIRKYWLMYEILVRNFKIL